MQKNEDWNSVSSAASRAIGDLFTAYGVIAIGAALAFVFAFVYLQVVQCAASILVWVSLLCVLLGGAAISAACLNKADDPTVTGNDPNKVKALKGVGIVFAVCTFLYFCAIVFMRDRIRYVFVFSNWSIVLFFCSTGSYLISSNASVLRSRSPKRLARL